MIYPPVLPTDKDEPAEEQVHNAIKQCTFNGLETDRVFITDTDKMKNQNKKVLYTQASRARLWLGVIGKIV